MIGRRNSPPVEEVKSKPKGFDDFDLRLGDVMRGERATMGKSLLDVQRELKIKANYVSAIENADPTAFETQGFIAGYVRSYARYLGLDPEWAYQRFCDEGGFKTAHGMSPEASTNRTVEIDTSGGASKDPFVEPAVTFVPKAPAFMSRLDPGAIGSFLVISMLLTVILYGGFAIFREIQKVQLAPVAQAPGVVTDQVDLDAGQSVVAAADGSVGFQTPDADALDRLYRPQPLDAPILVARDGPIVALDPAEVGTVSELTEVEEDLAFFKLNSEFESPQAPAIEETLVQVVSALPQPVELFAVRPSWIRVQAADGTVLFEKILDAGEHYLVPLTEEVATLRAGNAGSVYFNIGDETFGPVGSGAAVVKDLELAANILSSAYPLADPENDADLARFIAVADAQSNGQ